MISQILSSTFNCQGALDRRITCPTGPEEWNVHTGIRIEGNHLTCEVVTRCPECRSGEDHWPGARYLTRFTKEFPHFEVAILETGKQIIVAIGVVNEGYNTSKMPGWEAGTVGYQSDGNICDAEHSSRGRQTKACCMIGLLDLGHQFDLIWKPIGPHDANLNKLCEKRKYPVEKCRGKTYVLTAFY